jgi:glycosyltransferase involved in cell wall biosynthesis
MSSSLPLVSILLITYNQEKLVEESFRSLLAQTYPSIEIIVADDFSKDKTRLIIEEIAKNYFGNIKIIFHDTKFNQGVCENINQAVKLCQGEMIFIAAGDDISLPNRCETVMTEWLKHDKKTGLIATDAFDMTLDGVILGTKKTSIFQNYAGLKDWIENPPYFFGSSHSWSSNFLKKFPPLNQNLSAEDHLMVFRAIISDGALTISEPLVKHRRGGVTLKKYISLTEKIQKLKVGFPDKYTLLQQMLMDAKDQVDLPLLKKYLAIEISECELAIRLFNSESISQKIIRCCKFDGTSIFFKLRLLTYTAFPSILKPIFWLKKFVRKYQ